MTNKFDIRTKGLLLASMGAATAGLGLLMMLDKMPGYFIAMYAMATVLITASLFLFIASLLSTKFWRKAPTGISDNHLSADA